MNKDFQTIWVQMRRPRDGDPGVSEPGYFRVEDDTIVLVDKNGVPRTNRKREATLIQIKAGRKCPENCRAIGAGPLTQPPRGR